MSPADPGTLDAIADRLYGLHPDAFVPARDDAVAEARQAGDRDLARAIGRLRRPTRAAWLANLLARERAEQLAGLLALADDLASAQRTLDGGALRALSAQRNRLVAAMAREGGRLAGQAGDSATESVVRDLAGILEAALADPAVADEVRSGRLTRTVSYSGFGPRPADANGTVPTAADGARAGQAGEGRGGSGHAEPDTDRERSERERAERERIERERAERERAVAEAERAADEARDRQESAETDRADADAAHEAARAQVADLSAELEAARERERTAAAAARAAAATARDAAREASTATARAERARGRLAELD